MQKKKIFVILGVAILLGILLTCIFFNIFSKPKLSEMDDDELITYLEASDIAIHELLIDVEVVRNMIVALENDPEHPELALGDYRISDLFEELREIVKMYYAE